MPLYEYQCGKCGTFELIRKFSDAPLEACPTCGGAVDKLLRDGGRQILIGCDDPGRAVTVLRQHVVAARAVAGEECLLQVTPAPGVTVAEVNRSMVEAGIAVERLEPVRATLEERFLEITSRLEAAK